MSFELADLQRRLANLIRVGVVAELDEAAARVRVKAGGITTAWLPWLTTRAGGDRSWWAPEPGEQVLLLAPSGELAQAVVMPAIYQDAHPAPADVRSVRRVEYQDGTVVEYDREQHRHRVSYPDGAVMEYDGTASQLLADLGGSKLTISRDSIRLESNGSSLEMDASGIRLNGARIDLN